MEEKQKTEKVGDPHYFACSCSENGKKECKELLSEVQRLLDADDSSLLTKIVYSLHWEYRAEITSIGCDMWCGIESKTFDNDKESYKETEPPVFETYIQCDQMEYGIAATWFAYYHKFGKKRIKIAGKAEA